MTEQGDMGPFEARFAERVRAYTDPATERRIDALAISRTAKSSQRATGWWQRRPGTGLRGRGVAGARWAVALVAVVLIGVVGIAVLGRPSDTVGPQRTLSPAPSASGPVPEALRHSWQRPYAVAPGLDDWPSGFLSLASGSADFGPEPGAAASKSAVAASGADTLVITATSETQGCAIGDIGAYRWSIEGKGTVLTLTTSGGDPCPAREKLLAGPWVRADLPLSPSGVTMAPGTYRTSAFDPFGEPGSGQVSYTVPAGWKVKMDEPNVFLLHHLPDTSSSQPATDSFVALFVQPRIAADYANGATCGPVGPALGVGAGIDDIVEALTARPGVVSTPPMTVTIGGFEGQMVDVHLAPSWTRGCQAPEGPVVGMPIIVAVTARGPVAGISPDHPLRLILLDLGGVRTMAIVVFSLEPSEPSVFEEQADEAMPIVESFEFHPAMP